jgi:hypothetical protein
MRPPSYALRSDRVVASGATLLAERLAEPGLGGSRDSAAELEAARRRALLAAR